MFGTLQPSMVTQIRKRVGRLTRRTRRRRDKGLWFSGFLLILVAVAAAMINTADIIADLKEWHGATQPSVIGPLMKQLGSTIVAAVGGRLLPKGRSEA